MEPPVYSPAGEKGQVLQLPGILGLWITERIHSLTDRVALPVLLLRASFCNTWCISGAQEDIPYAPEFIPTRDLKIKKRKLTPFFYSFPRRETTAKISHPHSSGSIEKKYVV